MQIVFQDPYSSLNPARTVGSTLSEPLEAFGEHDREAVRSQVEQILVRVHLPPEAMDRYPWQFSGGQRQRIAIARALILSPRLVILDEAVSSLDLSVQAQVLNLLQELQELSSLSYLFISHDLEVIRHMCDRVVVLYRGRVMESGPAARVSGGEPAHPYTYTLHQAVPVLDPRAQRSRRAAAAIPVGPAPAGVQELHGEGCPFAPRCPWNRPRCWNERPLLRPSYASGAVACHRHPEWRAELDRGRSLEAHPPSADGRR
jgi:oligopeptide/dipeptide ABC transporter ATP-binding protein